MSRISTPASIADSPEASRPMLNAVNAQLGVTPNLFPASPWKDAHDRS